MINKASFTGDVFSEASFTWDVFNESFIKGGGKRKSGEMQKKWEKEKDVKELKKCGFLHVLNIYLITESISVLIFCQKYAC